MDWQKEYYSKFKDVDEAVKVVKDGDVVAYGEFVMASTYLDEAFAKRVGELQDILLRITSCPFPPKAILADPKMEHIMYNDWHFSAVSRKFSDKGLCRYMPMNYHVGPMTIEKELAGPVDVAMFMMGPPDEDGYLNMGTTSSVTPSYMKVAKHVIVEINESVPRTYCAEDTKIHVSQVDCFVKGPNRPLIEVPTAPATDVDRKIAEIVMGEIHDGCCLQLGIGSMPNAVGEMIAKSDLKDLGAHTEMLCDAYVDMVESGVITGKYKGLDPGKIVYSFAVGTNKLYNFLDGNKDCILRRVDYTNNPMNLAKNDNMICLNNALEVDLYGQIASESNGIRQISGTGGQLDFTIGANHSKDGKALICLSSTYTDKDGKLHSRIKPFLDPCTIITVPRSYAPMVVTEYGIADLRGKSTWERAELLINIAHPEFRDQLIEDAKRQHIWDIRNKSK